VRIERRHKLRLAFGNGLSADVWAQMRPRFKVPDVLEFYGSTEGNVSMFNFDGKVGAIGRAPKWLGKRINFKLVQFDLETEAPVRSAAGLCVAAGVWSDRRVPGQDCGVGSTQRIYGLCGQGGFGKEGPA